MYLPERCPPFVNLDLLAIRRGIRRRYISASSPHCLLNAPHFSNLPFCLTSPKNQFQWSHFAERHWVVDCADPERSVMLIPICDINPKWSTQLFFLTFEALLGPFDQFLTYRLKRRTRTPNASSPGWTLTSGEDGVTMVRSCPNLQPSFKVR